MSERERPQRERAMSERPQREWGARRADRPALAPDRLSEERAQ